MGIREILPQNRVEGYLHGAGNLGVAIALEHILRNVYCMYHGICIVWYWNSCSYKTSTAQEHHTIADMIRIYSESCCMLAPPTHSTGELKI